MPTVGGIKDTIVESPFYLRARIHDSQTASVQFEIARENNQRTCQMYKFTIRRNREYPYSMLEQNLTFWSNSLELKHLAAGEYRICAIICSEYLKQAHSYLKKNNSLPISTCIDIHVYRSHFLVLTLYFLVVLILTFSQIIFTLRKRKFQARIKTALVEIEDILHKWRTDETLLTSDEQRQSYCILQNLVTLPASPVEHSITSPFHPPFVFHLDMSSEQSILEIPEKVIGNQFDTLEEELASTKQNNDRLTEMSNGINQCIDKMQHVVDISDLLFIQESFEEFCEKFYQECQELDLVNAFLPFLHSCSKQYLLSHSNTLLINHDYQLSELFLKWKRVLEKFTNDQPSDNKTSSNENLNSYHQLILNVLVPILRPIILHLNTDKTNHLKNLILNWETCLPQSILDNLLADTKLSEA